MSRSTDLPLFRPGTRLMAADLNLIVEAVRTALRTNGGLSIADSSGTADRARPVVPNFKWVRKTGHRLKAGKGVGGVPPEWEYSWIQPKPILQGDGTVILSPDINEAIDTSMKNGDAYGKFAVNGMEATTGSGTTMTYGTGVLLTQPSGATLTPLPIPDGREFPLLVVSPGRPGGYRFAVENGYSIACGSGAAQATAPPPGDPRFAGGVLGQLLRGVIRWP